MKAPISWLKDFVEINVTPEQLADKLVAAGFEVEEIIRQADACKNVVTGLVKDIRRHENADKLSVCTVDVGTHTVQIVTGASNVSAGDVVPVALDGAVLPCGKSIKSGELRGVASQGMLCSGEELCLTEDDYKGASVYGILILEKGTPIGLDINSVLGNDDVILDVAVTANRPDCNSIIGIAREVAAVLGKSFKEPFTGYRANPDRISNYLSVTVHADDLCPRYLAKCVKDVKIQPSPLLIQKRLKAVGIRPINNIVDITNYVLVEIGQPMHAFDYRNLEGGKIVVRRAAQGEKFVALDKSEHSLDRTMLVIADENKPVALGGVMGGLDSGVKEDTSFIVFEAAKFARDNIRRTSRTLNLRSDSSQRFEKGIDYSSQDLGMNRALALIQQQNAGTVISGTIDSYSGTVATREIAVNTKDVNDILGIKVPYKRMTQILDSLGLTAQVKGKKLYVQVPPYREDIVNANDVAEEVIRIYGYNKIKSTLLKKAQQTKGGKPLYMRRVDKLKTVMTGMGASEIVTYSFISPKAFYKLLLSESDGRREAIKLINPLGEDVSIMRTTLAPCMLDTLVSNINKGNKEGRFFEIARVFIPNQLPLTELPVEKEYLAFGAYGKDEDFFALKGYIVNLLECMGIKNAEFSAYGESYLHPGRSAAVTVKNRYIGQIGEVHPDAAEAFGTDERLYYAEIDIGAMFDYAVEVPKFEASPKYPAMVRDLAFIVRETVTADQMVKAVIKCTDKKLLESVKVFDIYKGANIKKGYMSMALTCTFRSAERTLKDSEVNDQVSRILRSLKRKFRARLR